MCYKTLPAHSFVKLERNKTTLVINTTFMSFFYTFYIDREQVGSLQSTLIGGDPKGWDSMIRRPGFHGAIGIRDTPNS